MIALPGPTGCRKAANVLQKGTVPPDAVPIALSRRADRGLNGGAGSLRGKLRNLLCALSIGIALIFGLSIAPARADPPQETLEQTICRLIESAASDHAIPAAFFTRLIWRESSFRPSVTSSAGAQGIAQFMPGTAREQGLDDPFDPQQAIPASASYLAAMKARFGNWGLAAAAYNAGPSRVGLWLQHGGFLPVETEDYVDFVTGRDVYDWAAATGPNAGRAPAVLTKGCAEIVAVIRASAPSRYEGPYAPFGVQLSGNFSKARALASYRRVLARYPSVLEDHPTLILGTRMAGRGRRAFYRVRLPAPTLRQATELCSRLQRAGGACVVLRN